MRAGPRVVFLPHMNRPRVKLLTGRRQRQTPEDEFSGTDAAKSDFAKRNKWENGGHATETVYATATRLVVRAKRATGTLEGLVRLRSRSGATAAAAGVRAVAEMEHYWRSLTVPKEGRTAVG